MAVAKRVVERHEIGGRPLWFTVDRFKRMRWSPLQVGKGLACAVSSVEPSPWWPGEMLLSPRGGVMRFESPEEALAFAPKEMERQHGLLGRAFGIDLLDDEQGGPDLLAGELAKEGIDLKVMACVRCRQVRFKDQVDSVFPFVTKDRALAKKLLAVLKKGAPDDEPRGCRVEVLPWARRGEGEGHVTLRLHRTAAGAMYHLDGDSRSAIWRMAGYEPHLTKFVPAEFEELTGATDEARFFWAAQKLTELTAPEFERLGGLEVRDFTSGTVLYSAPPPAASAISATGS